MKLLVTGSRNWTNYSVVENIILKLKPKVILHGGAKGLDAIADEVANVFFFEKKVFPANWDLGLKAGPIRNQKMIDEKPDVCLAFHTDRSLGKGTKDCVMKCLKNNIIVRLFLLENDKLTSCKCHLSDNFIQIEEISTRVIIDEH